MKQPLRIAMWSGPRTISTALMRAWSSRSDCVVVDEPLYAYYLHQTNLLHPMRQEILASQPTNWAEVVEALIGPSPGGAPIWYQKHMAHHLLPGVNLAWLASCRHAFLIRDPAAVVASYARAIPNPTLQDLGIVQQVGLFRRVTRELGQAPIVVDSTEVLRDPKGMLGALCARLGVGFDEDMLSWEPGPRDTDGVWGPHWYASVWSSTGFVPYKERDIEVPSGLETLVFEASEWLEELREARIKPV